MKTKVQFLIAASVLTVLLTDVNVGLAQQVFNIGGNNLDRWGTTANQNPQTTIRRVGIGDFTAYGGPKAALHVNENLLTDLIPTASNYYAPGHLFRTDGPSDRLNTWRLWTGGQQGGPTATEKGMIFNYGNNPTAADRNNFSIQATAGHLTFHTGTTNADGVAIERMRIVGGTGPTAGFVGIGTRNPQSELHVHDGATTYAQFTTQQTTDSANRGFLVGMRLRDAELRQLEQNRSIDIFTTGTNVTTRKIRITQSPSNEARVGIGAVDNPLTYLHIGDEHSITSNFQGYRPWMNKGVLCVHQKPNTSPAVNDNMYVGLWEIGEDRIDAIINWGNNPTTHPQIADRLRFVFTSGTTYNFAASDENGLEAGRISSNGNHTWWGIGDYETPNLDPKRQMDVYDNGLDVWGGRPQLRLSQELNSFIDQGNYTDFQTTGPNNNYDGDGLGVAGHLLINPRSRNVMKTVAINMIDNNTPLNNGLSLDVNGQVNIRSIYQNDSLNMVLVADPNNHNRVMWRDASTLGGGGSGIDYDWEHIPNLGVFSGHPNIGGYNDKSVYVGLPAAIAPLLERAVKFGAYGNQSGVGATGLPGLIVGGFKNDMIHQSGIGSGQSRAYGVFAHCKANGLQVDNSMNVAVGGNCGGAFINYGGRFLIESPTQGNLNCAVYGECPSDGQGGSNYAGFFNGDLEYTGFFGLSSDSTLKQNIEPMLNSLSIIEQLRPVSFEYKTNLTNSLNFPSGIQYGLIAQEVESIIPSLVSNNNVPRKYDENGVLLADSFSYKSIDYVRIIPFLISAIKELKFQNDSLVGIISNYENRLTAIENILSSCCTQSKSTNVEVIIQTKPVNMLSNKNQLYQNYPNPFRTITAFTYTLGESGTCELIIEDMHGRTVAVLVNEYQQSGNYSVEWDASLQQPGVYFYSLRVNGKILVKKAIKIE